MPLYLRPRRPRRKAQAGDAGVAQLVERNLAKVEVESSRLFSRSRTAKREAQASLFSSSRFVGTPARDRRRGSKAVMHRIANPSRSVRLRPAPPSVPAPAHPRTRPPGGANGPQTPQAARHTNGTTAGSTPDRQPRDPTALSEPTTPTTRTPRTEADPNASVSRRPDGETRRAAHRPRHRHAPDPTLVPDQARSCGLLSRTLVPRAGLEPARLYGDAF